jgi:hypothetical protein
MSYYILGMQCLREKKPELEAIKYFEKAISIDNA